MSNLVTAVPAQPTPDRRSFLATLAAAGVMTGSTAAALAAPDGDADHPDAELLELVALLAAADARRSALGFQSDAAYAERYQEPAFTEAVFWRRSDWTSVWMQKERLDSTIVEGVERFLYVTDGALADLYGKARPMEGRRARRSELRPRRYRAGRGDHRRCRGLEGRRETGVGRSRDDRIGRSIRSGEDA